MRWRERESKCGWGNLGGEVGVKCWGDGDNGNDGPLTSTDTDRDPSASLDCPAELGSCPPVQNQEHVDDDGKEDEARQGPKSKDCTIVPPEDHVAVEDEDDGSNQGSRRRRNEP